MVWFWKEYTNTKRKHTRVWLDRSNGDTFRLCRNGSINCHENHMIQSGVGTVCRGQWHQNRINPIDQSAEDCWSSAVTISLWTFIRAVFIECLVWISQRICIKVTINSRSQNFFQHFLDEINFDTGWTFFNTSFLVKPKWSTKPSFMVLRWGHFDPN